MLQYGYRPQLRMPQPMLGQQQMMQGDVGFDGKMLRKAMARKTVDYNTSAVKYLEVIFGFFYLSYRICFSMIYEFFFLI